jgi:hypothetical protein
MKPDALIIKMRFIDRARRGQSEAPGTTAAGHSPAMKVAHLAKLFGCERKTSSFGGNRGGDASWKQFVGVMAHGRIRSAIGRNDQKSGRSRLPKGSRRKRAIGMMMKRVGASLMLLSLGLILGSCSGVSAVVSDSWPHWAGGEPADTPPRPGSPGYAEFIAHKSPEGNAANSANPANQTNPQAASSGTPRPVDPAVVQGGLY